MIRNDNTVSLNAMLLQIKEPAGTTNAEIQEHPDGKVVMEVAGIYLKYTETLF